MLLLAVTSGMTAEQPDLDTTTVKKVYQRLLTFIEHPQSSAWPPTLRIIDDKEVNAFAALVPDQSDPKLLNPMVLVTTGMLKTLTPTNEDYYAYLLGHELAHHTAGHVVANPPKATLPSSVYSQMQEFEADSLGVVYAGRAGYAISRIREGIMMLIGRGMEYPVYAAIGESHPTFKERLARIDTKNSTVWRALSGFENGVLFLRLEQYKAAERCFRNVVSEFPSAHEAWSNLGYATLMLYCDALDESDLKRFNIGQIVVGGFHTRARSVENQVRGADEDLWWDAVGSLREALRLEPNSVVAKGALGLAYLVKPEGKDVGQATRYLVESATTALKDETIEPTLRATILANAAVLALEGSSEEAMAALNRIDTLEQSVRTRIPDYRLGANVRSSISYNRALVLARSTSSKDLEASMNMLGSYLKSSSGSHWWNLAYERYAAVCQALGKKPESSSGLQRRNEKLRMITTLTLPGRVSIAVSDPADQARRALPDALAIPIAGRTNLHRHFDVQAGVSYLAGSHVLAIILDQMHSPAVELRGSGLGAKTRQLKIGTSRDEIDKLLSTVSYTFQELLEPGKSYRVYSTLGLALRIEKGVLREIIMTNIPS